MKKILIPIPLAIFMSGCASTRSGTSRNDTVTEKVLASAVASNKSVFYRSGVGALQPTQTQVLNREGQIVNAWKDGFDRGGGNSAGWFGLGVRAIAGVDRLTADHDIINVEFATGKAAERLGENYDPGEADIYAQPEPGVTINTSESDSYSAQWDPDVAKEGIAAERLRQEVTQLQRRLADAADASREERERLQRRIDELIGKLDKPPVVLPSPSPGVQPPSEDPLTPSEPAPGGGDDSDTVEIGRMLITKGEARSESGCFLWKPESETLKTLVVLVPQPADWMYLVRAGGKPEFLPRQGELANPCGGSLRVHFRGGSNGASFGSDITVVWGTGPRPNFNEPGPDDGAGAKHFDGWPKIGAWTDAGTYRAARPSVPIMNFAQRGKVDGATNIKVLHSLYTPWKGMNEAQAKADGCSFIRQAAAEGYDGVCLDWERNQWANAAIWESLYRCAQEVGLPFIHAPKFGLDHHLDVTGISPEECVRIVERTSDGCFVWKYDQDAAGYLGEHTGGKAWWRKHGYTKPMCFLIDGQGRYLGDRTVPAMRDLLDLGETVVMFQPEKANDNWQALQEMAR